MRNNSKTGVILMTYGSATTAEHVREYFEHIFRGKASAELIADFEARYRLVGHSPLIEITERQASLLQTKLGPKYIVRAGMQHSAPFVDAAVEACVKDGAAELIGIILSPQFSSFIMEGYKTAFTQAAREHGIEKAVVSGPWPAEKHFIKLLVDRTKTGLRRIKEDFDIDAPVVFTTHSLPQRVVEKDPDYLAQIAATIKAVKMGLDSSIETYAAYQSAGHTPEEWLKPDLMDILADLRKRKEKAVLIVPVQFLADHLEISYDLDIAAAEQCKEYGIEYRRIELPNTDPLFIEALAHIAQEAAAH